MNTPQPTEELRVDSTDGVTLHTEIHGRDNAPTVVLSHAWTCSTALWHPVVNALGANYRVILYDQRGHGRSTSPARTGYSTTALADDLCAVLEATVPAGQQAVLGGHSMGGMTIMAAARRPQVRDRAAATLLASTGSANLTATSRVLPAAAHSPRFADIGHRLLLSAPLPLGPHTPITRAGVKYMALAPDTDPDTARQCAHMIHQCPTTTRARWGSVLAKLDIDTEAAHLDAPTVVAHGTSDRLTPLRHAHHLSSVLPRCQQILEIPGIGHMTPLETPDHLAGAISELVATHLRTGPANTTATP
ncbi:alpha/beta fold hydrolase [Halostreptopolyspora alba]|uniref:Alpha/beta hydrolase n=1 Tax=Halostreptopolyspora alba TaxID=2487137 RepID=A0A3N0EG85_9ACTN|nr:alpha/beta hydrolase [Nocardiopsaceae bacterium YIM 96095]